MKPKPLQDLPERPTLSVIIVTFQSAGTLEKTLQALPWHWPGLQVTVIDNHSTDRTPELLKAWAQPAHDRPGRITPIYNMRNRYYAKAVNQGLTISTGDYILLVGPDVQLLPSAVDSLADYLHTHPGVGVVAPQLRTVDGQIQPSCRRFPGWGDAWLEISGLPRLLPGHVKPHWKMPDFDHTEKADVEQPEASCLLIRRQALDAVGPMDTRFPLFFNDVDWCFRLRAAQWPIHFFPKAKVRHIKGGSVYNARALSIWKSHQGFYHFMKKHRTKSSGHALLLPCFGLILIASALLRYTTLLLLPTLRHRI